jgi:hypothetical protein
MAYGIPNSTANAVTKQNMKSSTPAKSKSAPPPASKSSATSVAAPNLRGRSRGVEFADSSDAALSGDTRNILHHATLPKVGGADGKTVVGRATNPCGPLDYNAGASNSGSSESNDE